MTFQQPRTGGRQPIFNLPSVIVALLALMAAIHLVRTGLLDAAQDDWVILNFAFFSKVPDVSGLGERLPGAEIWSFVTYGLLHGSWTHLGLNAVWMAAFGSPLARRFGVGRFLVFSAIGVAAGALVHLITHSGEEIALVGASAGISAHMAGAARFLFITRPGIPRSYRAPAASLAEIFTDRTTLSFLGVWLAVNIAVGLLGGAALGSAIAWEAHIGGFLAGLLLFPLFDPVPRQRAEDGPEAA